MQIEGYVLGGQVYDKDSKTKTFLQIVTVKEGRGVFGYDLLGGFTLEGDFSSKVTPMTPVLVHGSLQRFGSNTSFRISSVEF